MDNSVADIGDAGADGVRDRWKRIFTVSGFVDHFGTIGKAASVFGVGYSEFQSWQKRNKFPADRYAQHQAILESHRFTAPKSLWGQK